MAIDTRDKRASIIGFASFSQIVLPNPDSDVDRPDRAQLAISYPGVLPALLKIRGSAKRSFDPTTDRIFEPTTGRIFEPTISATEIASGGSRTWKADE